MSRHCWDNSCGPKQQLCVVSTPGDLPTTCLFGLDRQMCLPTCPAAKHTGKGKGSFQSKTKHLAMQGWIPAGLAIIHRLMNIHNIFEFLHEYATNLNCPAFRAHLQAQWLSKTFSCLSRFKGRPDSFLYHISLLTVALGQH